LKWQPKADVQSSRINIETGPSGPDQSRDYLGLLCRSTHRRRVFDRHANLAVTEWQSLDALAASGNRAKGYCHLDPFHLEVSQGVSTRCQRPYLNGRGLLATCWCQLLWCVMSVQARMVLAYRVLQRPRHVGHVVFVEAARNPISIGRQLR